MISLPTTFISIVVPTFNRGEHITKTIQSVLQQENRSFELIVVDDGSTDNTEEIVLSFTDSRIKYFKKSNAERAAARNYGVKRAQGDFVTFLDSDDLLKENHLSEAVHFIGRHTDVALFHLGYDVINPDGTVIYPWKALPDPVNDKLAEGNFLSCLGVFVKKEILLQYPFIEDRELSGSEDYELWIRLAARFPIRAHAVVTASLVNHETRSVLQIDSTGLMKRISLAKEYIGKDMHVRATYGSKVKKIFAYLDLYAALHLAMGKHRVMAWKALIQATLQAPSIVTNYRFLVVIKKLILF